MPEEARAVSSPTASTPSPPGSLRLNATIDAVRHLIAEAMLVRAHIAPDGRRRASVFGANGLRVDSPLRDQVAIAHWVTRTFPSIDWTQPHSFDLTTGRVWPCADPMGDTSEHAAVVER